MSEECFVAEAPVAAAKAQAVAVQECWVVAQARAPVLRAANLPERSMEEALILAWLKATAFEPPS